MLNRAEAIALAHQLREYKATSMVAGGRDLASFVLAEEAEREAGRADNYRQIADALTECQARGTELLEHRRALCRIIGELDKALKAEDLAKVRSLISESRTACAAMK